MRARNLGVGQKVTVDTGDEAVFNPFQKDGLGIMSLNIREVGLLSQGLGHTAQLGDDQGHDQKNTE